MKNQDHVNYYDESSFSRKKKSKDNAQLEMVVTRIIQEIGIPANINGYYYVRSAIVLSLNEYGLIHNFNSYLYPEIARQYQSTPSRVEKSIRHAIEVAWSRGRVDIQDAVFGYSVQANKGKPTNTEFITHIVDLIRLNENL